MGKNGSIDFNQENDFDKATSKSFNIEANKGLAMKLLKKANVKVIISFVVFFLLQGIYSLFYFLIASTFTYLIVLSSIAILVVITLLIIKFKAGSNGKSTSKKRK